MMGILWYVDTPVELSKSVFSRKPETTPMGKLQYVEAERTKQMEQILNFQVPAEGLELVILLHTQY